MSTERIVDALRRRTPQVAAPLPTGFAVLLFATLPFHWLLPVGAGSVHTSYGDPVVAVIGCYWLLGGGPRQLPRYVLAIAAFFVTAVSSLALATVRQPYYVSPASGALSVLTFTGSVAWMIATYVVARGRANRVVPIGAAVSVAISLAFAVWSLYSAIAWGLVRAEGPFQNPNLFGQYLAFNACLALYLQCSWGDRGWSGRCGGGGRRPSPRSTSATRTDSESSGWRSFDRSRDGWSSSPIRASPPRVG